jgi:hypothetical protein
MVGRWLGGATAKRCARDSKQILHTVELWENRHTLNDASNQRRAVRRLGRGRAKDSNVLQGRDWRRISSR